MTLYTYTIENHSFIAQGAGNALPPCLTFADVAVFNLTLAVGVLADGDILTVAIDSNMEFYDPLSATGDATVMAVAHKTLENSDSKTNVEIEVPLGSETFRSRVNGLEKPLRVHVGLYVTRNGVYQELALGLMDARPVVAGPNAVTPVLPVIEYPTREEAEALAERSENAAERAEAAAAGIVPPLQLDAPPTTSTAGSVGQLAVWHDATTNKDHLYHLCFISTSDSATLYHWEGCVLVSMGNVAGGYPVLDENGKVARSELPAATYYDAGIVPLASNGTIDARRGNAVLASHIEYAVRSVLPNVTEIPAATSDYSLVDSSATTLNHSHTFSHSPSAVPTYRLPQVTNTAIAHYIELTVDFTAVQTYSFLDYAGEPIIPLFTPAIAAGDVYTFKIEYSAIKAAWLIYPQKQGAVADDFVMRGEVGAANGVAGLDSNAHVPIGQLPHATHNAVGVIKPYSASFNIRNTDGQLTPSVPTTGQINNRTDGLSAYRILTVANLNYAVTAAITDAHHITLNDAQKATAQSVFGVGGQITAIPAATSQYTLSYGRFSHIPELASVYVLPAVADGTLANDIVLSIKFSSTVLTYEFQDSNGTTLVPLPLNGDIEDGSVVTFLCRYNPLLAQWVIYPVMDGKEAQE